MRGQSFFEKNVSRGAPDWLPTAHLPTSGRRSRDGTNGVIEYPLVTELAGLMWLADLAALELHVPQWRIAPGLTRRLPDRLVFDLAPGPGTTIVTCCRIAERPWEIVAAGGLSSVCTTNSSKGMQVYCPIEVQAGVGRRQGLADRGAGLQRSAARAWPGCAAGCPGYPT
ncbi:DNA primase [Crossiella equi]|uniref:DNA primase n=1 Tax=Crossiella equi TaxID=130796 RepID=A0ABS5ASZ5_9PSEU|nr:hypothetical protein [Crossiella equi]MBP2479699.1 DNA primase [Crossiella equi]